MSVIIPPVLGFSVDFPNSYHPNEELLTKAAVCFFQGDEKTAIDLLKKLPVWIRNKICAHYSVSCKKQKIEMEREGDHICKALVIRDFMRTEFHLNKGALKRELQELNKWSKTIDTKRNGKEGLKEGNRIRNQWNIIPYDATCIRLSDGAYINANLVFGKYIQTQSPVAKTYRHTDCPTNTVDVFWQMVEECQVKTIVMLNGEEKEPYFGYFPASTGKSKTFGHRKITLLDHTKYEMEVLGARTPASVSHRRLLLTLPSGDAREVHHLKANNWRDFTRGDEGTILKLIELVKMTQEDGKSPIVIHCKAGVGRTSEFTTILHLADDAARGRPFSVYDAVRTQRDPQSGRCKSMMQKEEQYLFACRVLLNMRPALDCLKGGKTEEKKA